MKKQVGMWLLALAWAVGGSSSAQTIYQNERFTVTADGVTEGDYRAIAPSATALRSNYLPPRLGIRRTVIFKFSLNGGDNERPPFQDHQVVLHPVGGAFETPVYVFGAEDPPQADIPRDVPPLLEGGVPVDVTFRLDLQPVLSAFAAQGFYEAYDGTRIAEADFEGVYIAGGTAPLSWDFARLPNQPALRLTDPDGDGIFTVTLRFNEHTDRPITPTGEAVWQLSADLSAFPQYTGPLPLLNALHNLSLEEMLLNIRSDGAFMAGAEWPGVWTRDISYSIVLALAALHPDAAKRSLLAKVRNGKIIQDTGTGGSWPVSSDRMTWALAAWEVYVVTGDRAWLRTAFETIQPSVRADQATLWDTTTGLVYGESSFLDWREQSYPRWMDPRDIYRSQALGTNVVHAATYEILAEMAAHLGQPADGYRTAATRLRDGINAYLWQPEKGYYGQFRYGRTYLGLSSRAEALGEALAVLYGIASPTQRAQILENMPVLPYGAPSIFPQIPHVPPYHNDGIWPFVTAYWTWAAAAGDHQPATAHGLATLLRASALFLTNKENMVAETGDFVGTAINSDRQLWSVAGMLSAVYRVLFGFRYTTDGLRFDPLVPQAFGGIHTLKNVRYRNATLTVTLHGYGDHIASISLDGEPLAEPLLPRTLTGAHVVDIRLEDRGQRDTFHLTTNQVTPDTPGVVFAEETLRWRPIDGAQQYRVWRNGRLLALTADTAWAAVPTMTLQEFQVEAVAATGAVSFRSEPVALITPAGEQVVQPTSPIGTLETAEAGYTGAGYLTLSTTQNTAVELRFVVEHGGWYTLEARYANGSGPLNTDNKAAIRTVRVDQHRAGVWVMPQRGTEAWADWGYSNGIQVFLSAGAHTVTVAFAAENANMDGTVNTALFDHLRIRRLER